MPTITAVETQQHDSERVSIFLDGKFAFGASAMFVFARRLVVGRELTADEVEELHRDDEVERAFSAALNYLSYRPRSRREILDYFRKKKTDADIADAVVERLQRVGLVDDREFARFWVENRQSFRPRGSRALRAEMRQKGLESDVIDDALEQLPDEEQTAYEAGIAKARSINTADEREFLRRLLGYLQRRGFGYGAASAASRRIYRELTSQELEHDLENV